jgi:hypothetical protein
MFLIPAEASPADKLLPGEQAGWPGYYHYASAKCHGHIVFIQGKGSMLIVIISIRHFKEVTHEKDIQRNPV